jgi:hypothetical protein
LKSPFFFHQELQQNSLVLLLQIFFYRSFLYFSISQK